MRRGSVPVSRHLTNCPIRTLIFREHLSPHTHAGVMFDFKPPTVIVPMQVTSHDQNSKLGNSLTYIMCSLSNRVHHRVHGVPDLNIDFMSVISEHL